jgi:hypothetical protein
VLHVLTIRQTADARQCPRPVDSRTRLERCPRVRQQLEAADYERAR